MENVDWVNTSVGRPKDWPAALSNMVRLIQSSRFSMWMGWGHENAFFYNDAYAEDTLDRKHPWALGRPAAAVWGEIWDEIGPRVEQVLRTGEATWDENLQLILERSGFREETYHTFSYSPIWDSGTVVGMLCVVKETTDEVIGERRMSTLRAFADALNTCESEEEVVTTIGTSLSKNLCDLPFSLTYLVGEQGGLTLAASSGVPSGHAVGPRVLDGTSGPWSMPLATAVTEDLSAHFSDIPTGDWDVPARDALVVPIHELGMDQPTGLLVVGLNPLRSLDHSYRGFIELIAGQIGAAITRARALLLERRRAEALAALDKAKTLFFTNISHEFRTPLTLLLAPLEEVLDTDLSMGNRDRLELAQRNALRLLKLVNTLLDFSSLEAGKLTPSLEAVDLVSHTSDIAGMFRSAIEDGGLDFRVDCALSHDLRMVDPHMWELIVTNLLSNAFKHTFAGSIEVRLLSEEGRVRLDVADTGVGISPEEVPHLFSRFHRVPNARSRSHEGSGVGLSLVQDLVDLHNGELSVISEPDKGSVFSVVIPARTATPASSSDRSPQENTSQERDPGESHGGTAWASRNVAAHLADLQQWRAEDSLTPTAPREVLGTVLVADDNADMRNHVARLLSHRFEVFTATDGSDALIKAASLQPDVIVCDVMMPVMDGLEFVRRVRDDAVLAETPVVLLSARAGSEASVEGLELGADDYLVKPFSGIELVARVTSRFESGRAQRRRRLLARVSEEMGESVDMGDACSRLRSILGPAVNADRVGVAVEEGTLFRNYFDPPLPGGLNDRYHVIDSQSSAPIAFTARTGEEVVIRDVGEVIENFPEFAVDFRRAEVGAYAIVPLRSRSGELMGAFYSGWTEAQALAPDTLELFEEIAGLVAHAVERIRIAERETRIAEDIQTQFLELDTRPLHAVVAARYQPADPSMVVGGDFYDAVAIDDRRMGLAVGDVVGKGLPAALVMGQLRSAIGAIASNGASPAQVIEMVDVFAHRLDGAQCTTAAYCQIDFPDAAVRATLQWTCAGHPPPLVIDEGEATLLWEARRPPLGVRESVDTPVGRVSLSPTSLIVLYTDGLVERPGIPIDERLEVLRSTAQRLGALPAGEFCDRLIGEMAPLGTASDDVAVIAVRLVGAGHDRLVKVIRARLGEISNARHQLREWLRGGEIDEDLLDEILVAVGEAVTNAVEHGSQDPDRRVGLEVIRTGETIQAVVSDTGAWDRDASRSAQLSRGRGFQIMEDIADEMVVARSRFGSTVTMVFSIR